MRRVIGRDPLRAKGLTKSSAMPVEQPTARTPSRAGRWKSLHPGRPGLPLSGSGDRLVLPPDAGLADIDLDGTEFCVRPSKKRSPGTARPRSSSPISSANQQCGLHRIAYRPRHPHLDVRQRVLTTCPSSCRGARSNTRRWTCMPRRVWARRAAETAVT